VEDGFETALEGKPWGHRPRAGVVCAVDITVIGGHLGKPFHTLFPGVKINELSNLSKKYTGTGDLNIEDGTISVCTYEALQTRTGSGAGNFYKNIDKIYFIDNNNSHDS
jgi:hypothetical protein